ncbi:MAG: FG-GAP repeat protein, partial [Thermoplasmata archaeon]|nr:FG-GAP repeat protein [Thermoplasmata archaeon]
MSLLTGDMKSWRYSFMTLLIAGLFFIPIGAIHSLAVEGSAREDNVAVPLTAGVHHQGTRGDLRLVSGDIDLQTDRSLYSAVGSMNNQYFGYAVATGDVNGDGKEDLVVGENQYSGGKVYIFYSTSFNYLHTQRPSDEADVVISYRGTSYSSYFGSSIAVGDANGDGYDDILIGAYGDDGYRGSAYLFFGNSSLNHTIGSNEANVTFSGMGDPSVPSDANYKYVSRSTQFGRKVALKDLNGDGLADAIISQPYWAYYYYYYYSYPRRYYYYWTYYGMVFVFYGRTTYNDTQLDASDGDADIEITGWAPARIYTSSWGSYYYYYHYVYSYLGSGGLDVMDINGDGYNDLVIGSSMYGD